MKRWICHIILVACIVPGKLLSQSNDFIFKNFTERDGLCDKVIFCLLKDRNNTLWIGTQNGLARFDGKNFYTIKSNKEGSSIPNNVIQSLCEDNQGNIWGGTENGVFKYDLRLNKIIHFPCPTAAQSNKVFNIICDTSGHIYATTELDVLFFNKNENRFAILAGPGTTPALSVKHSMGKNCLLKDEQSNKLWVASAAGLYYYDLKSGQIYGQKEFPQNELFNANPKRALAQSRNGDLMVFDHVTKDIFFFNSTGKNIKRRINIARQKPDAYVITLFTDKKNRLWYSCIDEFIATIDLNDETRISRIEHKDEAGYTMAGNIFWDAFVEDNGSIWLGTGNGLSVCSPHIAIYKPLELPDKIPELKSSIFTINEDKKDKNLWLFSLDKKIIRYNPINGKSKTYFLKDFEADKGGKIPTIVTAFYFAGPNVLAGTNRNLYILNEMTQSWKPFKLPAKEYNDFQATYVHVVDSFAYITDGAEIISYNLFSNKIMPVFTKTNQPLSQGPARIYISSLISDSKQNLYWLANNRYIGKMVNGKPVLIELFSENTEKNAGHYISAVVDKSDRLWIVEKGVRLIQYDLQTGKLKFWNSYDGLANNHQHRILDDDNGNIWTVYFNKVSYFDIKKNSFVNFTIPFAEYDLSYYNSIIKTADGKILSAVGKDVFELKAEDFNKTPEKAIPNFSSINISGRDYYDYKGSNVKLKPNENSIQIYFGILIDPIAYPHSFDYILEGIDKEWIKSTSINQVNYNKLPSGKYTFRVVARGQNNGWVSDERSFSFYIQTPFYKTKWFLTGIILLAGGIMYVFYRYRLSHKDKMMDLRNKAQALEKEKALVMYENLKQQLNPHFLFNSLTSLNSLIETEPKAAIDFLDSLSKTYRYILKSRDNETVALSDEILFAQNYIKLQQTRFEKGFEVEMNIPEEYYYRKIVPVTLQNLIENAIKHNIIDEESPLIIRIFVEEDVLVVKNNLQRKKFVETSNRQGLANMQSLYSYLSSQSFTITEDKEYFTVRIPLI